jgi:hypothetical protein
MERLLLICVVVFVLVFVAPAWADPYLECNITDTCSYTEVIYLENESGGYWNAHAQLVTNGSYTYAVCCNSTIATLSNSSCVDVTVLKISDTTNAHVQAGNYTGPGSVYTETACLSDTTEPGAIECIYTNSDCGSDYECLASIASSESSDENLTNSHIGHCDEYLKNVCCRYIEASLDMSITKFMYPSFVVSGEQESVMVNITVKINETNKNIPIMNVSDEVPSDFPLPDSSTVRVYFVDYSPYQVTEITTNATVDINVTTVSGNPSLVMVNISDITQTDANSNFTLNDALMITYTMVTDEMTADEEKTMWTHAWIENNDSTQFDRKEQSSLKAALVLVRGFKSIWVPVLSNPQNLTGKVVLKAMGGTVDELAMTDYIPDGATLWDLNVTYYNSTNDKVIELVNVSDYLMSGPFSDTLPDGTYVYVYLYNFTIYDYVNWDGQLYDNDTLEVIYNVSVIGGGQWILPTIIAGWDPQYKKHITTETHGTVNVPLFDIILETLTGKVRPGEILRGLLRMTNMGGPRAQVDVLVTYSAKTMQGGLIVERSETFAVTDQKEKELVLPLPEDMDGGMYTFEALVTYTGREALSTDIFEVIGTGVGTGTGVGIGFGENIMYYILIAVMGVIIGALIMVRRK